MDPKFRQKVTGCGNRASQALAEMPRYDEQYRHCPQAIKRRNSSAHRATRIVGRRIIIRVAVAVNRGEAIDLVPQQWLVTCSRLHGLPTECDPCCTDTQRACLRSAKPPGAHLCLSRPSSSARRLLFRSASLLDRATIFRLAIAVAKETPRNKCSLTSETRRLTDRLATSAGGTTQNIDNAMDSSTIRLPCVTRRHLRL
jgi:hypothetical protein